MSVTYANISDPAVLADYQSVLQPGAVIAGPLAETLRAGQLGQDALDWLKTNFYKTALELGHCLRLPQEGPCECDLYLTCAKFVTTPHYARVFANACAWSGSWPAMPENAAGTVKSTDTSASPTASAACCSANSANPVTRGTDRDVAR
jgi:hypothetical protein